MKQSAEPIVRVKKLHRFDTQISTNSQQNKKIQPESVMSGHLKQKFPKIQGQNIKQVHHYVEDESISPQKHQNRPRKVSTHKSNAEHAKQISHKQFTTALKGHGLEAVVLSENQSDHVLSSHGNYLRSSWNSQHLFDFSHLDKLMVEPEALNSQAHQSLNRHNMVNKLKKCVFQLKLLNDEKRVIGLSVHDLVDKIKAQIKQISTQIQHRLEFLSHKLQRHFREVILVKWKQQYDLHKKQHENQQLRLSKNQLDYKNIKISELEQQIKQLKTQLSNPISENTIISIKKQHEKQKQRYYSNLQHFSNEIQSFTTEFSLIKTQQTSKQHELLQWQRQLEQWQKQLQQIDNHLKNQNQKLEEQRQKIVEFINKNASLTAISNQNQEHQNLQLFASFQNPYNQRELYNPVLKKHYTFQQNNPKETIQEQKQIKYSYRDKQVFTSDKAAHKTHTKYSSNFKPNQLSRQRLYNKSSSRSPDSVKYSSDRPDTPRQIMNSFYNQSDLKQIKPINRNTAINSKLNSTQHQNHHRYGSMNTNMIFSDNDQHQNKHIHKININSNNNNIWNIEDQQSRNNVTNSSKTHKQVGNNSPRDAYIHSDARLYINNNQGRQNSISGRHKIVVAGGRSNKQYVVSGSEYNAISNLKYNQSNSQNNSHSHSQNNSHSHSQSVHVHNRHNRQTVKGDMSTLNGRLRIIQQSMNDDLRQLSHP